jgi:hypothetical protein
MVRYFDDTTGFNHKQDCNCYSGSETKGTRGVTIWGPLSTDIWLPSNGGWTGSFTCTEPKCYHSENFCLLTYKIHTSTDTNDDVRVTQSYTTKYGTSSVDLYHSKLANHDDVLTHDLAQARLNGNLNIRIYDDVGENTISFTNHSNVGVWLQSLQIVRGYNMYSLDNDQQTSCPEKQVHLGDNFVEPIDYPCNFEMCGKRSFTWFTPDNHLYPEDPGTDPGTILTRGDNNIYSWTWTNPPQPSAFSNYVEKSHCLFNFNNICLEKIVNQQIVYDSTVGATTTDVPFQLKISNSTLGTSNWATFYHPGNNSLTYNAHIAHGVDLATDPVLSAYYNDAPGAQNTLYLRIPTSPNDPTVNFILLDSGGQEEGTGFVNLYRIYETKPCCPTITSSITGGHGSVSPSGGPITIPEQGQTFDMSPNTGYHVSNVTIDGTSKGSTDPYTVFMNDSALNYTVLGMEGHQIQASFTDQWTITVSHGSGGTISPGTMQVANGTNQTFYMIPDTCYNVAHVYVNDIDQGSRTSYTFTNVQEDKRISATFGYNPNPHTITASAGPNGSISPSGNIQINCGYSQTFTITPNYEYVPIVTVDGTVYPAITSYTFAEYTSNHSISVEFIPQSRYHYVTSLGGAPNGNVTTTTTSIDFTMNNQVPTSSPIYLYGGGTQSAFGILSVYTSNNGVSWSPVCENMQVNNSIYPIACGTSQGPFNYSRIVSTPVADYAIGIDIDCIAVVSPTYCVITASAGTGGSISPNGNVNVTVGNNQTFTITASEGYQLADVLVNGSSIGANSNPTISNVQIDQSIHAQFSSTQTYCQLTVTAIEETTQGSVATNVYIDNQYVGMTDLTTSQLTGIHNIAVDTPTGYAGETVSLSYVTVSGATQNGDGSFTLTQTPATVTFVYNFGGS